MASTLAAAAAITKVGYGDIHDQLDGFIVALDKIESGSQHITELNTEVQFATRMGRSAGIGARGEFGNMPTAGQGKNARASISLKYQYGTVQGTGQVFKQVASNTQGFINWMDQEVKDVKESLQRDLSRQVYGDGTGTLGLLTSAATTTVLQLDDAHWCEVDMYVDVLTAATLGNNPPTKANSAGALQVTAVNRVNNQVTVSSAVTSAVGSAVVRSDPDGVENNWNKEWWGLGMMLGSNTLYSINPATFPRWLPGYTQSSVGTLAELTLTHLLQGIHGQGGKITDFLTTYGVMNAYWNILQGSRRYTGDTKTLVGGGVSPTFQSAFGDVPITPDHMAPAGTVYALNKEEMYVHRQDDWDWLDKDGNMWKQVPNKDAYVAYIFQYSNIGTFRRNTHGKLSGITEL